MVQKQIKKYYNQKRSKGPDLKEGDKVQLLYKNFKSRHLSKKLDYLNQDFTGLKTNFQKLYTGQTYQQK